MRRIDWRDDRGQAGGAETVPFAILIFVIGSLMVLNLWSVITTKMAVNAAAREAAHAIAEATPTGGPSLKADLDATAYNAAAGAMQTFRGEPPGEGFKVGARYPSGWQRCAVFDVTVEAEAKLVRLPMVGALDVTKTVSATASSVVDPYRDSVAVPGSC